jgi:hypothetical protein
MKKESIKYLLIFSLLLLSTWESVAQKIPNKQDTCILNAIQTFINDNLNTPSFNAITAYYMKDSILLDSFRIDDKNKVTHIFFNKTLSFAPIRENTLLYFKESLATYLDKPYTNYAIVFYSNGSILDEFIPNYYKTNKKAIDKSKTTGKLHRKSQPLVQNISTAQNTKPNLYNINIALWHSHGWYYEPSLHRWEWQRARLLNTVEDLFTMSFTMNYLVPMLENAGANLFIPRERDWQTNEIIVDNDSSCHKSIFKTNINFKNIADGFALGPVINSTKNPFKLGTSLLFKSKKKSTESIEWIPNIPEDGLYPIYISYQSLENSTDEAYYRVYHQGGTTEFKINQKMGGGTWVYLGKFNLKKGLNPESGKVELLNTHKKSGLSITADAVRFGSGMGNISRNGLKSERPRYQEAARYYLQYAGFPDSLVWDLKKDEDNDYNDDLRCRGEWINYLMESNNKNTTGLNIPIDLSLAFHTDAGITDNDTVIGTLGIYSTKEGKSKFPSGLSKMASRDLTDIIQTQIVNDIRAKYDSSWTRRSMWDKGYSEAYRQNVPSMLLELCSHQNLLDARFSQDPKFQFDVSRSIYKGMVKFLSSLYKIEFVIQPLPISHFQTQITDEGNIKLKWQPVSDPLEETATPTYYILYTKKGNTGFDNGILVSKNEFTLEHPQKDIIYSFKITAVNKGGESFPSEELSTCISTHGKKPVLIINAFDRLGGKAWFNDTKHAGFLNQVDQGVPYNFDFHTVGYQYDFDKKSPWLDDDSPGFGASSAELENVVIPGNTFDFSFVHGQALKNAGYSFASVSDETVESGLVDLKAYTIIDFIAGEEKTNYTAKNDSVKHFQIFTHKMTNKIEAYLLQGGNLFISGAYIGTDAHMNQQDSIIGHLLKYKWRTNNASVEGNFYATDTTFKTDTTPLNFNTKIHPKIYTIEAADAIEPFDSSSQTIFRYKENNMSAGTMYTGKYTVIALGFPFETIMTEDNRFALMKNILTHFNK